MKNQLTVVVTNPVIYATIYSEVDKMKKILLILTLLLSVFICSCDETSVSESSGEASQIEVIPDSTELLEFEKLGLEGNIYVKGFKEGVSKDVISVPASFNGKAVVGISENAFKNDQTLKKVLLPEGLKYIGYDAFVNCKSLEEINIPKTVIGVGSTFEGCDLLLNPEDGIYYIDDFAVKYDGKTKDVALKDGTRGLSERIFYQNGAIESVIIPATVTKIPEALFYQCSGLKSVTLSEHITFIPANTFNSCTTLKSIDIPASVKTVGEAAFSGCSSLEKVTLHEGLESISKQAFHGCAAINEINLPTSLSFIEATAFTGVNLQEENGIMYLDKWAIKSSPDITEATFRKDTVGIASSAFENGKITKAAFTESLIHINDKAFSNCKELEDMILPYSLKTLGVSSFEGCESLGSVIIPGSIDVVSTYAFNNCTALSEIIINEGIKELGLSAFASTPITAVRIPDSVINIEECVFENCKNLKVITLPAAITDIKTYTFKNCESLTEIVLPEGIEAIGLSAFENCKSLEKITLPNGLTRVAQDAFKGCTKLFEEENGVYYVGTVAVSYTENGNTDSIKLREGTRAIQSGAFMNAQIKSAEINSEAELIPVKAFASESLETVLIPESVTKIEEYAFAGCKNLKEIKFGGTKEQWDSIEKAQYWDNGSEGYTVTFAK